MCCCVVVMLHLRRRCLFYPFLQRVGRRCVAVSLLCCVFCLSVVVWLLLWPELLTGEFFWLGVCVPFAFCGFATSWGRGYCRPTSLKTAQLAFFFCDVVTNAYEAEVTRRFLFVFVVDSRIRFSARVDNAAITFSAMVRRRTHRSAAVHVT